MASVDAGSPGHRRTLRRTLAVAFGVVLTTAGLQYHASSLTLRRLYTTSSIDAKFPDKLPEVAAAIPVDAYPAPVLRTFPTSSISPQRQLLIAASSTSQPHSKTEQVATNDNAKLRPEAARSPGSAGCLVVTGPEPRRATRLLPNETTTRVILLAPDTSALPTLSEVEHWLRPGYFTLLVEHPDHPWPAAFSSSLLPLTTPQGVTKAVKNAAGHSREPAMFAILRASSQTCLASRGVAGFLFAQVCESQFVGFCNSSLHRALSRCVCRRRMM
jgi:hypothetical protein